MKSVCERVFITASKDHLQLEALEVVAVAALTVAPTNLRGQAIWKCFGRGCHRRGKKMPQLSNQLSQNLWRESGALSHVTLRVEVSLRTKTKWTRPVKERAVISNYKPEQPFAR